MDNIEAIKNIIMDAIDLAYQEGVRRAQDDFKAFHAYAERCWLEAYELGKKEASND